MHRSWRNGWFVLALAALAGSGCSAAASAGSSAGPSGNRVLSPSGPGPTVSPGQAGTQGANSAAGPTGVQTGSPAPGQAGGSPGASRGPRRATAKPLAGMIIGIDPGHDGGNFGDPSFINALIWNGLQQETCDTTGTQTDSGYTEALFNFKVASFLRADLVSEGAKVVMTRTTNNGVGPCVTTRAQIINRARADVAIDIHADGGPASGRGFTVLEPVADGPNDRVITSSQRFGADVRAAMLAYTSMPKSNYDGQDGISLRNDLAGLNLTTVPKILIECGNMRNATDAALLVEPGFQRQAARAFAAAIVQFLTGR